MNRLIVCGLAALVLLSGCGPSLEQQRNDAISSFQVGRMDTAKAQFKQIVDRHPGDSESFYYLGRIFQAQGQYEFAIYNYQNALTSDPSNADARKWLDRAQKEAGQTGETLRFVPTTTAMTKQFP